MGWLSTRLIRYVLLGACGLGFLPHALSQTLQQSVLIALSQYPTILAAQSRQDSAQSDITRAQAAHWPQVAWSGTQSAYNAGNVPNNWIQSPTVSMNIWSGWKIESDVERSRALADAGRHQQRITRDDVALLATEGYLNWARSIELVRLARKNADDHERLRQAIFEITQIDQGRRIDLDQAEVRFENANLSLQQREAEMQVATQRLNRMLLGQIPPQPDGIDFQAGKIPSSFEQALADLNDAHPRIAQQKSQIEAARASVLNARSQHSPTVNVTYGKQVYQGSGQGDYVAQLNVQIPIFTGGMAMAATDAASAQLQAAEFDLQDLRLTLREKVLSAWSEWKSAQNRAVLGKRQSETASTLVEGYQSQFQIGRRSLLDLLTVQNDLYTYRSNAINAAFDARVAYARIMAATGKLAIAYQVSGFQENEQKTQ